MSYEVIFHPEVKKDIKKFNKFQQILIVKQFEKIKISPELGSLLGNKNGYDLSGCRKMYVDNKKIRIVYKIIDDKIIIEVVAVGKRNDMEVYSKASKRL